MRKNILNISFITVRSGIFRIKIKEENIYLKNKNLDNSLIKFLVKELKKKIKSLLIKNL